jgi:phosphate transport system substrate-binding protein
MKKTSIFMLATVGVLLMGSVIISDRVVNAQDMLRYSCSNQVFNAFEMDNLEAFTKATGIKVDVHTASSASCVYGLMNGQSDIASIARKLYRRHQDCGCTQIPFARDPLTVIAHKRCGIKNVTSEQLQDIFSGNITNWKELGGSDLPITIIVPGKDSAANKNFRRQVMKHKEIKHDLMAFDSTLVIEAVKYFPCGSISFISHGAALRHKEIVSMKINGYNPTDKEYPYYQVFYYIIQNEPILHAKKFIDFTFSEQGAQILRRNGMVPIAR